MALPFLSWLTGGVVEATGNAVSQVGRTFWGDKAADKAALSAEQLATLKQYADEFAVRQHRTWWDSLVDGVNRMVRPTLALGAQATFFWAAYDPVTFAETMRALQLVPDMLWTIWLSIFAFFFGGRILEKAPMTWRVQPNAIELAREIVSERTERVKVEKAEKQTELEKEKQTTAALEIEKTTATPDNTSNAIRTVAATIWGEARNETHEGKIAVGCVIRNRANSPGWWGKDLKSVCLAKAQFSCWWDKQGPACRTVDETDPKFAECLFIAEAIASGEQPDITNGADHYYANYIATPRWAKGKTPVATFGVHKFYRLGRS